MVMAKFLIIKAGLAFIQHDRQKPTPDLKFFFSIINDETKKVSPIFKDIKCLEYGPKDEFFFNFDDFQVDIVVGL